MTLYTVQQRAAAIMRKLATTPRPAGVKRLTGASTVYRIRFANAYRMLYQVDDGELLILVLDIGHRSTIYDDY